MLFYPTKKTCEVYSIQLTTKEKIMNCDELLTVQSELDDDLYKWGIKLFYIRGKKCLQIMNFASKLAIVFLDCKKDMFLPLTMPLLHRYLKAIYEDNVEMQKYIDIYMSNSTMFSFLKLDNRSVIGSLNENEYQMEMLMDIINESICNGIINTNYVNSKFADSEIATVNKKYVYCKDEFERILKNKFIN